MLISKKSIPIIGIILTTISLILAVTGTILAAVQYNLAAPVFVRNPFKGVPGTQIGAIIFSFFVILLSFIAFTKPSYKFSISVAALMLISLLFNLAIAIYSFVAGNKGRANIKDFCKGQYKGVIGVFSHIDTYLQLIDQYMCSEYCPCFLDDSISYQTNSTLKPYYNLWIKTSNPNSAIAFQNCSIELQNYVFDEARRRDDKFAEKINFNFIMFYDYMSKVEDEFKCSGWCETEYFNTKIGKKVSFEKYLFTNINDGPPIYIGCLDQLIQWLPGYLNAWGSIALILSFIQLALVSLLIFQYTSRKKDHQKQIPHHHQNISRN